MTIRKMTALTDAFLSLQVNAVLETSKFQQPPTGNITWTLLLWNILSFEEHIHVHMTSP
jgi:hypothetical protein